MVSIENYQQKRNIKTVDSINNLLFTKNISEIGIDIYRKLSIKEKYLENMIHENTFWKPLLSTIIAVCSYHVLDYHV